MEIKLLVSRSGPAGAFAPGDVIEVDDDEAKRMFEAVPPQAIPVRPSVPIEMAGGQLVQPQLAGLEGDKEQTGEQGDGLADAGGAEQPGGSEEVAPAAAARAAKRR